MAMTDRDKKVMAVVALLAVLGIFWFVVLGGKRSAVTEAQQAKTDAQTALDTAKQAEAAAKAVKQVKPEAYAKLIRLGAAIPRSDDFTGLMVQINDIADDADVQFINLAMSSGAGGSATEGVGGSSCDVTAPAGEAAPAAAATPETGATPGAGSTAETWVGRSKDKAEDARDAADARTAAVQAAACAAAPTLADLSAQAAGLDTYGYTLTFKGSFFNLDTMFGDLLGMVRKHNGRLAVDGRLLDIRSINLSIESFPLLNAAVEMTGYSVNDAAPAPAPAAPAAPAAEPAATTEGQ